MRDKIAILEHVFKYILIMTDYEYILQQAKKFHFAGWNDEELRKCVDMLPNLSRQELITLTLNKWTKEAKVLRECIFNILYKDKIGKREERIKNLETNALVAEFQNRNSGNVALCRAELKKRYKAGRNIEEIAELFAHSNKSDQAWLEKQQKKENE